MYIGESLTITFNLDENFDIDLNQAEEIEIAISNNNLTPKVFKLTDTAPDNVVVDVTGLKVTAYLQHDTSKDFVPGRIVIQLKVKMPTSLYPDFPDDGMYAICHAVEEVLPAI